MTNLNDRDALHIHQLPLKQRGYVAAEQYDIMASKVRKWRGNPLEAEMYDKAASIIRQLADALPGEL